MNLIEAIKGFLLFIANLQLLGNHANILGFFWFLILTLFMYSRFKIFFRSCYSLRCSSCNFFYLCCPDNNRRKAWHLTILFLSAYVVFFFQMILDDSITTPINLLFGSWELREPVLGSFSLFRFLLTKWDVYAMILLFALVFYSKGIFQFFHFTKQSMFWLVLIIAFSVVIASTHWWLHLRFEGWMRAKVFWLSYPEFRILTGFFVGSIIKKPKKGLK